MVYQARRRLRPPSEAIALREELLRRYEPPARAVYLYVCGCHAEKTTEIAQALAESLTARARSSALEDVALFTVGCHGFCSVGPSALLVPSGVFYAKLTATDVARVVKSLLDDQVVTDLTLTDPTTGQPTPLRKDLTFFQFQTRRLLRNCGEVDPWRIEESLMRGAYESLAQVLQGGGPREVVQRVEASGLRGRGITTVPCAEKWKDFSRQAASSRQLTAYVRTWHPAAQADYLLLESDPHLFLEGMALAALATGCESGRVVVPPERPHAALTLKAAVNQACAYGLLGHDILGTTFSFEVHIETGKLVKYPYSQTSLNGAGASVAELFHNVETLANLPSVMAAGTQRTSEGGAGATDETVLVALGQGLQYQGVGEVACGTAVTQVMQHLGGGPQQPENTQGAILNGPLGRILSARELSQEPGEQAVQATMLPGAADLALIGADECVVNLTRRVAAFLVEESCGKCAPCRIGTCQMKDMLDDFCRLAGSPEALDTLRDVADALCLAGGCEQGTRGAACVLSAIAGFEKTFLTHTPGGYCSARVCVAQSHVG
ncbi:MAG: hypothetical protein N2512_03195 [Armatimonadetes bacterium]|nr:hypothetical protein [Armatimonadota bacterium]